MCHHSLAILEKVEVYHLNKLIYNLLTHHTIYIHTITLVWLKQNYLIVSITKHSNAQVLPIVQNIVSSPGKVITDCGAYRNIKLHLQKSFLPVADELIIPVKIYIYIYV